jgi:hypothetical protein
MREMLPAQPRRLMQKAVPANAPHESGALLRAVV